MKNIICDMYGVLAADGIVCDAECMYGCWDVGNQSCVACQHFSYNGACVAKCSEAHISYSVGKKCFDCDPECIEGCRGPVSVLFIVKLDKLCFCVATIQVFVQFRI